MGKDFFSLIGFQNLYDNILAMVSDIQILLKTFFSHLGVTIESLEIQSSDKKSFCVSIQSPDSALLIGNHGIQIDALEKILKIMISHKTGEPSRFRLEINDYKKTKSERLFHFIDTKIQELKQGKSEILLPNYDAYERKKIHDYIHKLSDTSINSKSTGEGKERRMTLFLTGGKRAPTNKLTIDIDGTDI